jgi:hypothetical protein
MRINVGKTSKLNFEKSSSKKASNNSKIRNARLEEKALKSFLRKKNIDEFFEDFEEEVFTEETKDLKKDD